MRSHYSESDDEGFSNIEDDDDREDDFSTDDGSDGDEETTSSVDEGIFFMNRPGTRDHHNSTATWSLVRQARRTFESAAAQLFQPLSSRLVTEQCDIDKDDGDGDEKDEMEGNTVFVAYLSETEEE